VLLLSARSLFCCTGCLAATSGASTGATIGEQAGAEECGARRLSALLTEASDLARLRVSVRREQRKTVHIR
jgi:hypothetical protein